MRQFLVALTLAAAFLTEAKADSFTTQGTFGSALSGLPYLITFDGLAGQPLPGSDNNYNYGPEWRETYSFRPEGMVIGGVTFQGGPNVDTQYLVDVIGGAQLSEYTINGSDDMLSALGYDDSCASSCTTYNGFLTLTFPTGITAVGMEIGKSVYAGQINYMALLSDGQTYSGTLGTQGRFLGFTSAKPISSLSFTTTGDGTGGGYLLVDNLQLGTAADVAATPEPSSFWLMAAGALAFAAWQSKGRSSSRTAAE